MRQTTTDDDLQIDELAERAGLTVRTLHHYDRIGLVRASERTERPADFDEALEFLG